MELRRTDHLPAFPFPTGEGLAPLPEFAELRRKDPVVRVRLPSGDTAWLVTRHTDVRRVLTDPRFSRSRATRGTGPRINRTPTLPDSILAADPPTTPGCADSSHPRSPAGAPRRCARTSPP